MKKVIFLLLASLLLSGCGSEGSNETPSYEVDESKAVESIDRVARERLEEGDGYASDGDTGSAERAYLSVVGSQCSDEVLEEAYTRLIKVYSSEYKSETIRGMESEILKRIENPSEELLNLIEYEGSKDWYLVKVDYNYKSSFTVEYKYDEQGRLIESNGIPFKTDGYYKDYLMNDKIIHYFDYLEDGRIHVKSYNTSRQEWDSRETLYTVDEDGFIINYQFIDSGVYRDVITNDLSFKHYTKVGDITEVRYYDDYHNLYRIENLDGSIKYRSNNMYDEYGNLVRIDAYGSSNEQLLSNKYYYVYANGVELQGDISGLPMSTEGV